MALVAFPCPKAYEADVVAQAATSVLGYRRGVAAIVRLNPIEARPHHSVASEFREAGFMSSRFHGKQLFRI